MVNNVICQLYSKKLNPGNVGNFIAAGPENIGWQINLVKFEPNSFELRAAIQESRWIVDRLRELSITSVFLLHPSTNAKLCADILANVGPDIFLASAERTFEALSAISSFEASPKLMVPIGIPQKAGNIRGYSPIEEVKKYEPIASFFTTDTIRVDDSASKFGCSGEVSDFEEIHRLVGSTSVPVVIAGGISPNTLEKVHDASSAFGFDACTAVCSEGLPDYRKACEFVAAVRRL